MISQRLKTETLGFHKAIESNPLLMRLTKSDFTYEEYAFLLKSFYVFYSKLEQKLEASIGLVDILPKFQDRFKTPLLLTDLLLLNVSTEIDTKLNLDLPKVDSLAQAIGVFYVLEGATLGGQIIQRFLKKLNWAENCKAFYFYNAYDVNTGQMWKSFLQAIDSYNWTPEQENKIIISASTTFVLLDQFLVKSLMVHQYQ